MRVRHVCALVLALASPSLARADVIRDCATAHFEGQTLREGGHFKQAHERFVTCANDACPAAIRKECASFLEELERVQPTVVIEARDPAGEIVLDVRVAIDGESMADRLTGRAMSIDPGPHTLRLTLPDGRVKEQSIAVLEGDHARRVSVRFDPIGATEGGATTPAASSPGESAAPSADTSRPVPTSAWVFGIGGSVALANGIWFGTMALLERNKLGDSCGPTRTCDANDVGAMHTKALVADISFAVAAGAIVASAVILLANGQTASRAAAVTRVLGGPISF